MSKTPKLIQQEELWNVITHGLGVVMSIVGGVYLLNLALTESLPWGVLSASVFILTMLILYIASTLYHAHNLRFDQDSIRLKLFDHIAIYFLIAGTYTPFTLILLDGFSGYVMLASVWSLAIIGTIFKLLFHDNYPWISLLLYIFMGWIILFDIQNLYQVSDIFTLSFLIGGGVSYTIGTLFYMNTKWKFHHPIWHLFVLLGTGSHFIGVCSLYSV
jgi:hemolysin III